MVSPGEAWLRLRPVNYRQGTGVGESNERGDAMDATVTQGEKNGLCAFYCIGNQFAESQWRGLSVCLVYAFWYRARVRLSTAVVLVWVEQQSSRSGTDR